MRKMAVGALPLLLAMATGGTVARAEAASVDDLKGRHAATERLAWNVTIVWDRLDDFLDRRDDIEVVSLDRDDHALTGERTGVNRTGWVTCETTDLSKTPVDMRFDVALEAAGEGTGVTVSPYFIGNGEPLPDCRPTGEFSELVFRAL